MTVYVSHYIYSYSTALSATPTKVTGGILEGLKLSQYFDFILAAYEASYTKPDVK